MDEQSTQSQGQAEPPPPPPPSLTESQQENVEEEEVADEEAANEDEELIAKAQKLMEKITSSPDNPNCSVLHALVSLLETQESRYSCLSFACRWLRLFSFLLKYCIPLK